MTTTYGLTQSYNLAQANNVDPYRPKSYLSDNQWWGNTAQSPASTTWTAPTYQNYNFQKLDYSTPAPTYQTYAQDAPTYKGLNGGDYNRYELSVRTPGELAANTAYKTAKTDLADAYSAKGLYGSSQYTRQMSDNLQNNYMNTLTTNAANAATQRYNLQQQDQQFASQQEMQAWVARMQENQAANQQRFQSWTTDYGYKQNENNLLNQLGAQNNAAMNQFNYQSSVAQRDWNDQQANRQINFQNSLAQDRQNWDLQRLNWDTTQNDNAWNRIFGVYGDYDPETERYQKKLLREQVKAAENSNSSGGLLSIGKSLLSGLGGLGSLASQFSTLGKTTK
ncbi:hypothetical protein JCM15519_27460 [Fundidesulfovibrio butyratiphilus]